MAESDQTTAAVPSLKAISLGFKSSFGNALGSRLHAELTAVMAAEISCRVYLDRKYEVNFFLVLIRSTGEK